MSSCRERLVGGERRESSPSGHLVVEDSRVGSSNVGLEALVELSDLSPVLVEPLDVLVSDSSSEFLKRHEGEKGSSVRIEDATRRRNEETHGLLESSTDSSHSGLGGESRENCRNKGREIRTRPEGEKKAIERTIDRDINDIGSGSSTGEHGSSGDTSGIVGMNMDGEVGVSLSDSSNEPETSEKKNEVSSRSRRVRLIKEEDRRT